MYNTDCRQTVRTKSRYMHNYTTECYRVGANKSVSNVRRKIALQVIGEARQRLAHASHLWVCTHLRCFSNVVHQPTPQFAQQPVTTEVHASDLVFVSAKQSGLETHAKLVNCCNQTYMSYHTLYAAFVLYSCLFSTLSVWPVYRA